MIRPCVFLCPPEITEAHQERLALPLFRFSPVVALWPPDGIVVDLAPSRTLAGGEQPLVLAMSRCFLDQNVSPRIAVAHSLAAARLAAWTAQKTVSGAIFIDRDQEFVDGIPIEAVLKLKNWKPRFQPHHLGLSTLGSLRQIHHPLTGILPQKQLDELLLYARRSEALFRQLRFLREPEDLTATIPFFPSVFDVNSLLFPLKDHLAQLQRRLERLRLHIAQLKLVLITEDSDERPVILDLACPTRDPGTLCSLCRIKLDQVEIQRPLAYCRVEVSRTVQDSIQGQELFLESAVPTSALSRLVNRLQSAWGHPCLFRVTPAPALLPEQRFRHCPPLGPWLSQGEEEGSASVPCLQSCLGTSQHLGLPLTFPFPSFLLAWREERALPQSTPASPAPAFRLDAYNLSRHEMITWRYTRQRRVGTSTLLVRQRNHEPAEVVGTYD